MTLKNALYSCFELFGDGECIQFLGPAKQPTEECLEAFFSACCQDVEYTQNNKLEFYENGICVRHR